MKTIDGLSDQHISFDEDHNHGKQDTLIIKREQDIPDEHIAQLKRDKIDPEHKRLGEFHRIASIPVVIVEKWMREGFRIEEHSARELLAKLRHEDLDAFITTNKNF
jgi:hypothetical protein